MRHLRGAAEGTCGSHPLAGRSSCAAASICGPVYPSHIPTRRTRPAPISRTIGRVVEEGVDIPEEIEVDCTGVKLKDVLRTERTVFPDG